MKHGVILMTALLPTVGHKFLIDFANTFMKENIEGDEGVLHVIVSALPDEPVSPEFRVKALDVYNGEVKFYIHDDPDAPQRPSKKYDFEFWEYWRDTILRLTGQNVISYVFSSETYGEEVATMVWGEHIICDPHRSVYPVKGTDVRKDIYENWNSVHPNFSDFLHTNVVLYGPESCGKTTMANRLVQHFGNKSSRFVHEWARPYLESKVEKTVTKGDMLNIAIAQHATEKNSKGGLFTFFDTDLLSTYGYFDIMGISSEDSARAKSFIEGKLLPNDKTVYIMMNDNIPFEADPIRYGGDKRESNVSFWMDLLNKFGRRFYVVQSLNIEDQLKEIVSFLETEMKVLGESTTLREIENYIRK